MPTRIDYAKQFEELLRTQKTFNGKQMGHWRREAAELVVEQIVRAALQHTDSRSIIGHIARKRLLEIARSESPQLYAKVLKMRARSMANFARILAEITAPPEVASIDRRTVCGVCLHGPKEHKKYGHCMLCGCKKFVSHAAWKKRMSARKRRAGG